MKGAAVLHILLALVGSPLLLGVIARVKALVAGRTGPPLIQPYHDLVKCLRKGAVYSTTTGWVFKAGPLGALASVLCCLPLLPAGGVPAPVSFSGDLFLFAYFLGLSRFFMITAALDTGSAFEGMGASREAALSALAEPALFVGLLVFVQRSGGLSLSSILGAASRLPTEQTAPLVVLVAASLFILLLTENARIPVDDPNTHLELTMIHEVMILDHGGPDLGFFQYAQALKLWVTAGVLAGVLDVGSLAAALPGLPAGAGPYLRLGLHLAAILGLTLAVGLVESSLARLRMNRLSQILAAAGALSTLALLLLWR